MSTVGDLRQLKTDQDSYNDNNAHGARIQLSFDFREDLTELEHPTEYPDSPPSDAGDDDTASEDSKKKPPKPR